MFSVLPAPDSPLVVVGRVSRGESEGKFEFGLVNVTTQTNVCLDDEILSGRGKGVVKWIGG